MRQWIYWAEKGWIPDLLIRFGIRRLCKERLRSHASVSMQSFQEQKNRLIEDLCRSPLAVETDKANEQHYEMPPAFFELVLGKHLKYSACYYPNTNTGLNEAEANMLDMYCIRSELKDGMEILELGCGWGSLTLWLAQRYPNSRITAISNSTLQRSYILRQSKALGIYNLSVLTCDINTFQTPQRFDRVISIEMFEHLRNYHLLLNRISSWLKPEGKLFVHIFTHHAMPYLFEDKSDADWMSRYFFTGGMMPSDDLLFYFQQDLRLEKHWIMDGTHYEKTADHWLNNLDRHQEQIIPLLRDVYGRGNEILWLNRWRIFFMACAELFGYRNGKEWLVSHYRFSKK